MEFIQFIIDFILHIDRHLIELVQDYHLWTYAILFVIIFCETGLVVTPFLPGDSLLFVAGAITAQPDMPLEIGFLMLIIFLAAVLGDSCNYTIGHFFGKKLFSRPDSKIFKQSYLDKTHEYFKKYGGKTIILSHRSPTNTSRFNHCARFGWQKKQKLSLSTAFVSSKNAYPFVSQSQ